MLKSNKCYKVINVTNNKCYKVINVTKFSLK